MSAPQLRQRLLSVERTISVGTGEEHQSVYLDYDDATHTLGAMPVVNLDRAHPRAEAALPADPPLTHSAVSVGLTAEEEGAHLGATHLPLWLL
jgi:hypothetical protein